MDAQTAQEDAEQAGHDLLAGHVSRRQRLAVRLIVLLCIRVRLSVVRLSIALLRVCVLLGVCVRLRIPALLGVRVIGRLARLPGLRIIGAVLSVSLAGLLPIGTV